MDAAKEAKLAAREWRDWWAVWSREFGELDHDLDGRACVAAFQAFLGIGLAIRRIRQESFSLESAGP